jgi:ribosomal protein L14
MTYFQSSFHVRDNSGAKSRYVISRSSASERKALTRVVRETKSFHQVRKGIKTGTLVQRMVVNTRKNTRGRNGIYRRNQQTSMVLLNQKGGLLGTRIRTKLPKYLSGKGRMLRPTA